MYVPFKFAISLLASAGLNKNSIRIPMLSSEQLKEVVVVQQLNKGGYGEIDKVTVRILCIAK